MVLKPEVIWMVKERTEEWRWLLALHLNRFKPFYIFPYDFSPFLCLGPY